MAIDELVDSVTIYKSLPFYLHGGISPFFGFYILALYFRVLVGDFEKYREIFLAIVSIVAVLQVLVLIGCFLSIHVKCFFSCRKMKNPYKGDLVKVIPTPNNGRCDLVKLNHSVYKTCKDGAIWFMFQKTKYIWCEERKKFCTLEFPVSKTFGEYLKWEGYVEEDELFDAHQKYGLNKLDIVVPKFMELVVERATDPSFVYLVTSILLISLSKWWLNVFLMMPHLIMLEFILFYLQRINVAVLNNIGNKSYLMQVYRKKIWSSVNSNSLFPGDIVSIGRSHRNTPLPCDLLLIHGSCAVNESMLTGKTIPQIKEPIENFDPNKVLDLKVDGKLHMLYSGTEVVWCTSSETSSKVKTQDEGCRAYVLRTGFSTSRGILLRDVMFDVKKVTANNLETLGFILFLLILIVAAFCYTLINYPTSNNSILEKCFGIIMAVLPVWIYVELFFNAGFPLSWLEKLHVNSWKAFRIPTAGKVQVCCFDKTGTLTESGRVSARLIDGIGKKKNFVKQITEASLETARVLALCHSLIKSDEGIIGDYFERSILSRVDWELAEDNVVIPKQRQHSRMKILRRFHFSSALRRMSVLAGNTNVDGITTSYVATVKGAPETLKSMFVNIDGNYDKDYSDLARGGNRILALGWKEMGCLSAEQVKNLERSDLECDLKFCGFLVISCSLKPNSKAVIQELLLSKHKVVMITGDNPFTACYVAKKLLFTQKKGGILILTCLNEKTLEWAWQNVDKAEEVYPMKNLTICDTVTETYDLCVTGEGLMYLNEYHPKMVERIVQYACVFARVSPKQKEFVIVTLKSLGYVTLMCGDGTNDVGALKLADVGVSLDPFYEEPQEKPKEDPKIDESSGTTNVFYDQFTKILEKMNPITPNLRVKDACLRAPFISRLESIECVCHIIKQGRFTMVTTHQTFKILALTGLILAYGLLILCIEGVTLNEVQVILSLLFIVVCGCFVCKTQPLKTMSPQKPLANFFNVYNIGTILSQFAVYVITLVFVVRQSLIYSPPSLGEKAAFSSVSQFNTTEQIKSKLDPPNVTNSAICIVSLALILIVFAINDYRGRPLLKSVSEDKALLSFLLVGSCSVIMFSFSIWPSFSKIFQIVEFDNKFQCIILATLIAAFVAAYFCDIFFWWLQFGGGKLKVRHSTKQKVFSEV